MDLNGKVCLVTGAGSGIGEAIARLFVVKGAYVVLTDIQAASVEAVAASIGSAASCFVHDTSDEQAWIRIVETVVDLHGRIDVLVNNAGYGELRPIGDVTLEIWRRMMSVNCDGVFLGMKYAIPFMAPGSSIVNMSSVFGKVGGAYAIAYAASKGAVTLMTKAAALECADTGLGIRVNSLHPGFVDTPAFDSMKPQAKDAMIAAHPVGRVAMPSEIANAALFLASSASSFMTGSELVVDGGYTAR